MYYHEHKATFVMAYTRARDTHAYIAESTTHPCDLPGEDVAAFYLHADEQSGFGLVFHEDGTELVAVFSCKRGRGQGIMDAAEKLGANCLDHFDGYLTKFYEARGWIEYNRVPSYVPGQPDVIYRSL